MDRVPKKKARKGLKKGPAALLLLFAVLAAGIGAYFVRRPVVPPLPDGQEKAVLLFRPEEEIESVAIEPGDGAAYTLVRREGAFRLEGMEEVALRMDVVEQILLVCADLKAEETVLDPAEEAVDLADFGLMPPAAKITVGYTDGSSAALLLGDPAPQEIPQRYCMAAGDPRLHTLLSSDADVFFHEADYLRFFTQPEWRPDLLDRITVTGEVDLDLHYTPSGWILDRPFHYPLSTLRTDALLARIGQIGFEACLGTLEEVDLKACGLDDPPLTVTLVQAATVVTGETGDGQQVQYPVPAMTYTLKIGRETGKSGVYVGWNGSVYKASNFLMGFWKELRAENLLLREPVNLLVNDLARVAFACRGITAAYEVEMVESVTENNQIATDAYGQVLYDAAVQRAGETGYMDAAAFLSWYQRLAALSPAGALPEGYQPAGEPWARIALENSALTRDIAFYAYDALHSAMAVDGTCRYYVDNSALEALADTP